ncbi:MAG TPA: CBS domain-containing protein [Thermodesulfobacteriota bacterium]
MSTPVETIGAAEPASAAWSRMRQRRIRHLVVTDDSHLVGILSERDLGGRNGAVLRKGRTVEELMTPGTVTVQPNTTLRQAANLMRGRQVGSLPVLEGDRLVGIVTATDVLDALGRGSTRPTIRAERPTQRSPASATRRGGRPIVRRRTRASGRTDAPPPMPVRIRATGVALDRRTRNDIRRRFGDRLGKFAPAIERVNVGLRDVNGPRGGVDTACRVAVVLHGLPSVVVEGRDASRRGAVNRALAGVERAVRRALQRRRTLRARGRRRGAVVSTA